MKYSRILVTLFLLLSGVIASGTAGQEGDAVERQIEIAVSKKRGAEVAGEPEIKRKKELRYRAGCLPFKLIDADKEVTEDNVMLLMISSNSDCNKLVFPKGGIEADETGEVAAHRETWEEAGVKGNIIRKIHETHEKSLDEENPIEWYLMEVTEELEEWPEKGLRCRYWKTPAEIKSLNDEGTQAAERALKVLSHAFDS